MGLMGIDFGLVVGVHPEGNSIDVLMDNGGRLSNVQVMAMGSSDSTGKLDLPDVGFPLDDTKWNATMKGARRIRAVITSFRGRPFCIGMLFPQITQMTFQRTNFRVERHASDFYETVNENADVEWSHPSGSFMRIAESPVHENLTGLDYDGLWAIKQNTASAPWFNLTVANAGAVVANIQIDPEGNVSLTNKGNLTANVSGEATVNITGTTTVNSGGAATLKAPSVLIDSPATTVTGSLLVEGALTFQSGMTGSTGTGGGATVTITGDANFTGTVTGDTDVIAAGKSGKGHTHGGVQEGGDDTDPPN